MHLQAQKGRGPHSFPQLAEQRQKTGSCDAATPFKLLLVPRTLGLVAKAR